MTILRCARTGHLLLASVLVAAAACVQSTGDGRAIAFTPQGTFLYECDPNADPNDPIGLLPISFDTAQIERITTEEAFAILFYDTVPGGGITLGLPSGSTVPAQDFGLEVFAADCAQPPQTFDFRFEVHLPITGQPDPLIRTSTSRVVLGTTEPQVGTTPAPQMLAEAILGGPVPGFMNFVMQQPTGVATCNSNPSVTPTVPQDPATEIFATGAFVTQLSQQQIDDAFSGATPNFPVGVGPMGLTLEAVNCVPMMPGEYLFTWACVEGDVPITGSNRYYQYGFVSDDDGVAGNNYFGQPPFDKDYFDGTDRWREVRHDPAQGWDLRSTLARNGAFTPEPTATRAIVYGQAIVWITPLAELDVGNELDTRWTSFSHVGDFGQSGGFWSGDPTPAVSEPLFAIPLQLTF